MLSRGMHGRGGINDQGCAWKGAWWEVCMAGGMVGWACMAGRHAWQGMCMAGGVHGRVHAYHGGLHGVGGGLHGKERRPLQRTVRILLECILVM